jgi:hypothetical protein
MLEIPVQFFAISPDRVRRTSIFDGLRAIALAVGGRLKRVPGPAPVTVPGDPHRDRAWTGF